MQSPYDDSDKEWHPVTFCCKRFSPAELNYDIHNKEMFVIVDSFKEWRHMPYGSPYGLVVILIIATWNISRPAKYLTDDRYGGV